MKRKVVLALALIFILAGCGEKEDVGAPTSSMEDRTSEETEPKVSTDLGSIAVFFPELEGAQEAEWEQITMGSGDSRAPGPTDYKYQGYVTISGEAAEKYASSYEWEEREPKVELENIEERSGEWKYCYDFEKDMLQGRYGGSIWIDGDKILFSIITQ